jgi:hypothetical protein
MNLRSLFALGAVVASLAVPAVASAQCMGGEVHPGYAMQDRGVERFDRMERFGRMERGMERFGRMERGVERGFERGAHSVVSRVRDFGRFEPGRPAMRGDWRR